jgi:hypothetical protein
MPSGLFPTGPPRPTLREPHPVRAGAVWAGAGVTTIWFVMLAFLAMSVRGYVWLTLLVGAVAWSCALGLARYGDRGVAAGISVATSIGVSAATIVVIVRWATTGWPLW